MDDQPAPPHEKTMTGRTHGVIRLGEIRTLWKGANKKRRTALAKFFAATTATLDKLVASSHPDDTPVIW